MSRCQAQVKKRWSGRMLPEGHRESHEWLHQCQRRTNNQDGRCWQHRRGRATEHEFNQREVAILGGDPSL